MKRVMGFLIFSLVITAVLLLLHWFVQGTAVRFLQIENQILRRNLLIALLLLGFSFLPATLIAARYYNWLTRGFYILSVVWLGFFLYFLLAACLAWLIYFGLHPFLLLDMQKITAVLLTVAALVGVYGIAHAENLQVTSITVKLNNLPAAWQGKTAVWVSDLHLGQVWSEGSALRTASIIQSLHPDIVFVGGDFYDGLATNYDQLAKDFANLGAPWGTYFITGNHEEFSDGYNNNRYVQALQNVGITILNNEKMAVNGVQIIGVDYQFTSNRQNFQEILNSLRLQHGEPSILLKHSPSAVGIGSQAGVSLQLSGHTHQGQAFPGSLLTSWIFHGYDYGLKKFGSMWIYISSGAGTWGPPMRVGTKAEIVQIKFE